MRPVSLLLALLLVQELHAERPFMMEWDSLQLERTGDPVEVAERPKSPTPKQPLAQTVAEILKEEGASLAEVKASAGSCHNRDIWYKGKFLGSGNYANVFELTKKDHVQKVYALKVGKEDKPRAKEEVIAEAELLARIHGNHESAGLGHQCPNVVPVYEIEPCMYNATSKTITVMEGSYVTAKMDGDLANWIDEKGGASKLQKQQCRGRNGRDVWRQQLLKGLECAHVHGKVAHSDFKADNLLYDKLNALDGCPNELYLADFGLSEPLGKTADFFSAKDYFGSSHLVSNCWEQGPPTLNLNVATLVTLKKVYEDYSSNDKLTVALRRAARTGWRELDAPTSRLLVEPKDFKIVEELSGYTVSENIDFCSLICLVNKEFGWAMFVPGYHTPATESQLNCGMMDYERQRHFTGVDR